MINSTGAEESPPCYEPSVNRIGCRALVSILTACAPGSASPSTPAAGSAATTRLIAAVQVADLTVLPEDSARGADLRLGQADHLVLLIDAAGGAAQQGEGRCDEDETS